MAYRGAAVKPIGLLEASLLVKNSDTDYFLSHVYLHFKSSMLSPLKNIVSSYGAKYCCTIQPDIL